MEQHDHLEDAVGNGSPASDSPAATPDTAASSDAPQTAAEVSEQLLAKTEECQTLNDKYLRLAAEFDNYKRRARRDHEQAVQFANETLVKDMLPTLDNMERAMHAGREQGAAAGLLDGIDLTYKQCLDTLRKAGVTQFSSTGQVFDPARHQAVGHVESATLPDSTVVEEHQKGYMLHDRVVRPAMVTVAKTNTAAGETQPPQEGAAS